MLLVRERNRTQKVVSIWAARGLHGIYIDIHEVNHRSMHAMQIGISHFYVREKKSNTLRRDSRGKRTHAEKKHVDTRRVHYKRKNRRGSVKNANVYRVCQRRAIQNAKRRIQSV